MNEIYTSSVSEVSLLFWGCETSGLKHNGGGKRDNIWRKVSLLFWECETSRIKDKGAKESGLTYGVSHGHCTPESPYKVKRFVAQHHDHNWSDFSSRN